MTQFQLAVNSYYIGSPCCWRAYTDRIYHITSKMKVMMKFFFHAVFPFLEVDKYLINHLVSLVDISLNEN